MLSKLLNPFLTQSLLTLLDFAPKPQRKAVDWWPDFVAEMTEIGAKFPSLEVPPDGEDFEFEIPAERMEEAKKIVRKYRGDLVS